MSRRIALAVVGLAVAATALPAHAAPKVNTLYFANPGACDPDFTPVLQKTPSAGGEECTGTLVVDKKGVVSAEVYNSSKMTFKLDAKKPVTGVVHAMCQQAYGIDAEKARNAGYVDLVATVKLDNVTLGTVAISGPTMPLKTISKDFSFAIPAALKGKTAKKASVAIDWNTTGGFCAISYAEGGASIINIPTR